MAISKVFIENFKGVREHAALDIKPITVFIGTNSSGKSSCIHALACLSQSVRVTNDVRPIILDDEFASVHLGRFIEVIHSKSYQDVIALGLEVQNANYTDLIEAKGMGRRAGPVSALYRFKCTKRTQDTNLEYAQLSVGPHEFVVKRTGQSYIVQHTASSLKSSCGRPAAFFFDRPIPRDPKVPLEQFFPFFSAQPSLKRELANTFYLGPFRQAPLRRYATRGSSPIEVGPMGESTTTLLANEAVQSRARPHIKQIARWLAALGLARDLEVQRIASSDLFDVTMTLEDGATFPIADLGYGLSQVLPVLTQCSFAPKNSTLLFEQPELHLHTAAARKLATVFTQTAGEKNCHMVIESHSPELVKEFFGELRAGRLRIDDIVIYRVSRKDKKTVLQRLEIDAANDFDVYENWEKGVSVA